jgi:hypothetical protein
MATNNNCRYGFTSFSYHWFNFYSHWRRTCCDIRTSINILFFLILLFISFLLGYTDTNCMSSTSPSISCADVLQRSNYTGVSCTCQKNITLDKPFTVSRSIRTTKSILFFFSGRSLFLLWFSQLLSKSSSLC